MAIIVDCSHTLSRNVHMSLKDVKTNPEFVSHLLLQSILYVYESFGASKQNQLILALDSKPYWRTEYYENNSVNFPEYKGEKYKGKRIKDDSIPWERIFEIYNNVMDALRDYSDFFVMSVPNCEADDIIAVLSKEYSERGEEVFVISSDNDFKQLHNPPLVSVYDPIKRSFVIKIDADKYAKIHAIQGDKGDNIFAIKSRLGPKTAEKMLPELDYLLQTNPDMKARYEFNLDLTDFNRIPDNIRKRILDSLAEQSYNYDAIKLLSMFSKYRLAKISERIDRFRLPEVGHRTDKNTHFTTVKQVEDFQEATLNSFFD